MSDVFFDSTTGETVTCSSALAAVSLGAQNCLSQKSSVTKANTTFMTGNIQKMTEALHVQLTQGLKPKQARDALLILTTWSMYIGGGAVGVQLSSCAHAFCS